METQALVATLSSLPLPQSLARCQRLDDGRSVSIPSSLGRQWSIRVERRKVTLLSRRRKHVVDVRVKKAGAGPIKVKSKEVESEETDGQPAPGTKKLFKLPGTLKLPSQGGNRAKDNKTVFVAGATGKVGRRTVRELVRLGYTVRAGVRSPDNAQFLLEQEEEKGESDDEEAGEQPKKNNIFANFSVEKLFSFLAPKSKRGAGKVELVQCDLEKSVEEIEEAFGNAGVVICTIGASEKEVLDITGPYRIDYKATKNLIDAASSANVNHFILVTSLGTQKLGWPAAVLNLFWGVLYWKAKAEKALVESGIPFTIVRPGGMERPTDAYKETHNIRLAEADTLFGGQVSNLQVAELMAAVVGNLDLGRNKILEAVAETTAPLRPFEDLLAEISSVDEETKPVKKGSEISRESRQATKPQQEEERTEALRQKLQQEYEAARLKEEEAKQEAEAARVQKAEIEKKTVELRSKLQAAEQLAREAKALETALLAAARQGKKLSDPEKQDIIASVRAELEAEQKAAEAKQKALQAAKVEAPVKSKAEVAAQKQAKQEAEKKAKQEAEAELRAKAEAEAKVTADFEEAEKKRIEAEQKAKEEEEKIRIEAERKIKKEEAEKKKIEAERKAKEEEEEKMRIEAETKAQEEEEKKRIEAERKAKEEEEEKLRIEAGTKSQEEEEKQAATNVEAGAKPKGFRWPWQKEEPEEEVVTPSLLTTDETVAAEEPQTKELPRPSRPLSPYAQYSSLKPPHPPSPPPAPKVPADEATAAAAVPEETILEKEEEKAPAATAVPEEPVLEKEEEKAPAAVAEAPLQQENKPAFIGFRWPWQKPEPEEEPPQVETAAESTVEETAPINQTTIQEEAPTKETEELPRPSRPLSPYTAYPALKPPTPPSPPRTGKPGGVAEVAAIVPEIATSIPTETSESTSTSEPQKTRPLSPYIMYPGMKPPGPPAPPKEPTEEEPADAALSGQPLFEEAENGSVAEAAEDEKKILGSVSLAVGTTIVT